MNLPDFAYQNVVDLYNLHKDLAHGSDEQRRELTRMIVEQTTFDDSTGFWGHKAQKHGPPSKDTMGKREVGVLIAWDLFNGTTREPNPSPIQSFNLDASTQELLYYMGVDHLNHSGGGTPPPDDNDELERRMDELEHRMMLLENNLNQLDKEAVKDGETISLQTNDKGTYLTAEAGGGKTASQGKPGTIGPVATDRTAAGGWEKWKVIKQ